MFLEHGTGLGFTYLLFLELDRTWSKCCVFAFISNLGLSIIWDCILLPLSGVFDSILAETRPLSGLADLHKFNI